MKVRRRPALTAAGQGPANASCLVSRLCPSAEIDPSNIITTKRQRSRVNYTEEQGDEDDEDDEDDE